MALLDRLHEQFGDVEIVLGLSRKTRLEAILRLEMTLAEEQVRDQPPAERRTVRCFSESYQELAAWAMCLRVIGKAAFGSEAGNPRFVVRKLGQKSPKQVYDWCSDRGQAESRIKDFKRGLKADQLLRSSFVANFFRLLLLAAAHRLLPKVRRPKVRREASRPIDEMGRIEFANLRIRLLKGALLVGKSVRRVMVRLPASFGLADLVARLLLELAATAW